MNAKELEDFFTKLDLTKEEIAEILQCIKPIFMHQEFQIRLTNKFPHHGKMSLGNHILEDVALTYKLSKKYIIKHPDANYNLKLALKIAMMHDLYTVSYQNNPCANVSKFFNKHGFRHPIEAVINSYTWFPNEFKNIEEAKILIDGILHHMYPLPVGVFNDDSNNELELINYKLVENISKEIKDIITVSTHKNKIGCISLSRSLYKEGRIMAKADKKASFKQIDNIYSATALLTGKNKSLKTVVDSKFQK